MKKLVVTASIFLASISVANMACAQNSGWWVGGKIGYWHDKENGVSSNSISVAPELGYDFNSKWSAGVAFGLDYNKVESVKTNVFILEPYARYKYFSKKAFTLFVDGGLGVACGDSDGFKIGLAPGMAIKVSDHFSLLASVGFLGYKNDYYNGGGNGFGFNLKSSDLKFGFFYSF